MERVQRLHNEVKRITERIHSIQDELKVLNILAKQYENEIGQLDQLNIIGVQCPEGDEDQIIQKVFPFAVRYHGVESNRTGFAYATDTHYVNFMFLSRTSSNISPKYEIQMDAKTDISFESLTAIVNSLLDK